MKRIIITTVLSLAISAGFAGEEGESKASEKKSEVKIETTEQLTPETKVLNLAYEVKDAQIEDLTDKIPMDTQTAFNHELQYPEELRDSNEDGLVLVSFTYDEDGYIKILSSNASSEKLNEYIEKKLENIRLKNGITVIGKEYYAKFHFKLL